MNILNLFRPARKTSAQTAKDRLKIVVSHERAEREGGEDYLPKLQRELVDTIATVIAKYVDGIDKDQVKVDLNSDRSVLELNIALPEQVTKGVGKEKVVKTTKAKSKAAEAV